MVAKVFFDADLRYGIDGFSKILKAKRVGFSNLAETGDMMLFVNRARKHVKIFWGNKTGYFILQYRKNAGEGRITSEEIKAIPKVFSSGSMFNGGLEKHVASYLNASPIIYVDSDGLKVS